MRIQHNIMSMNAYRNYNNNATALSKNLEKLSSGYKINRAGDDAAGLAISEKMRAQITGLTKAQSNAKDGISLVKTAEGALTEVHDMLNRMYELSNQAANGTYSENDREKLQSEVSSLINEIDRIANATNFDGTKLFNSDDYDNEEGKITIQVGDTAQTYDQIKISVRGATSTALGVKNIDVADAGGASARTALDTISTAINRVSVIRSGLGAVQNRLEHTVNNLSVMTENLQDAESTIRDTDVADEMMAYTKNNILIQSAQAMLAQANQVPQGVLQLLQ